MLLPDLKWLCVSCIRSFSLHTFIIVSLLCRVIHPSLLQSKNALRKKQLVACLGHTQAFKEQWIYATFRPQESKQLAIGARASDTVRHRLFFLRNHGKVKYKRGRRATLVCVEARLASNKEGARPLLQEETQRTDSSYVYIHKAQCPINSHYDVYRQHNAQTENNVTVLLHSRQTLQ